MDKITVIPRKFILTLSEKEAVELVRRLKYRHTFIPDLTESVWKPLSDELGYEVQDVD